MSLVDITDKAVKPQHIAIIMDGNGRWATQKGLGRSVGHQQGVETLDRIVQHALRIGIRQLTLYAFSTENWHRPEAEVSAIMELLTNGLTTYVPRFIEQGIALKVIGEIDRLPQETAQHLRQSIQETAKGTQLDLIMALSYSSHREIQNAAINLVKDVQKGKLNIELLQQEPDLFENYLQTKGFLPIDLLIRTGGEFRVSNFLLYQIAYSELYFTERLWPDFSPNDLDNAIEWFQTRERRFGRVKPQTEGNISSQCNK